MRNRFLTEPLFTKETVPLKTIYSDVYSTLPRDFTFLTNPALTGVHVAK